MLKFIIVGMPRTGSTLVQTTLAQHPHIATFGELFHWVQTEREGAHAIQTESGKRFFDPEREDPISFLQDAVWSRTDLDAQAVGFKLFDEYVLADNTRDLFEQLKAAWPDLSVIYIDRRKVLDVLVSRRMAEATGEWVRPVEQPGVTAQPMLNIPVEEARKFFDAHAKMKVRLDQWTEDARCLRVEYEELSGNFAKVSKDMFEFLQVDPIDVRPAITKQASRPPWEVIENWGEFVEHFRGGEYEPLLRDDAGHLHEAPEPRSVAANPSNSPSPGISETPMPKLEIPPLNYDERLGRANLFRETFGGLSDEQWRQVLLRSVREPVIDGVAFPRLPDREMQSRLHGSADEAALNEAFQFFQFVKASVGETYLRPSARFLDFGTGWGRMLRPYLRYFDLSNMYAFEPNRLSLTVARSLNPHVTFLSGDYMPNRSIPRHMFDLIVGYSIFSHLSHHSTQVWLREVAELLNPGGVAVFTTWGERFINQLVSEKARLDAGQEIHWYYQFVLEKVGNPLALREHYRAGKFVWIRSLDNENYGETLLSPAALNRILVEHGLPLELVKFDASSLPQDAFILRRL